MTKKKYHFLSILQFLEYNTTKKIDKKVIKLKITQKYTTMLKLATGLCRFEVIVVIAGCQFFIGI